MQKLIRDRQIVEDHWVLLNEAECGNLDAYCGKDVLLPLSCWLERQDELDARAGRTSVWLDSDELPSSIGERLHSLELIALRFPVFKDGRPFSSARELRLNMGYKGEIRAVGDVLRDQLFYMWRCGFTAFQMREDQDLQLSLQAFDDFHDAYQSSVVEPLPLFRRRQSQGA